MNRPVRRDIHMSLCSASLPPVPLGSITTAFPSSLRLEAEGLSQIMGLTRLATHRGIEVKIGKENLIIPYRIHHEGDEQACGQLTGVQSILYSCLLTRHHDGRVRQRQLERILSVHEPWIVPFVFQLTGEYVIDILNTVEAHLPTISPTFYGSFIRDNQKYFQTTQDRMISYWDCYYRTQYKHRSDYVGFQVFSRFHEFAENY
ncbi:MULTISPECIES: hypothetical protein [unclassified Pseudomonas]|uniref:hypothetical protein n=1 Tax=unclassified Pseudomonas TaxID=196821 RepID=UPI001C46B219|nr:MULTISPECIES: hypothetical protein [unclassified Pseudomonas]